MEIEKIGQILKAIRQKLFGGNDNISINTTKQADDAKDLLLNGLGLNLDDFVRLNLDETIVYLNTLKGFNVENVEQLAECVSIIGFDSQNKQSKNYLEKALQLYQLCNVNSKTYSMERERNIITIENALHS